MIGLGRIYTSDRKTWPSDGQLKGDNLVDVYIYASGSPGHIAFEASWVARYIGHVDGKDGVHPDGMLFRPPSTRKYPKDNIGHWAIFWEVEKLRELDHKKRIPTGEFSGIGKSNI